MQNAELHRALEEVELSRHKYTELYDFAPVGYFTFDTHGLIREVNLAGAQLLGIERRLLMQTGGRSFLITSKMFCKNRACNDVKSDSREKAAR